jgi:hypothetical protein
MLSTQCDSNTDFLIALSCRVGHDSINAHDRQQDGKPGEATKQQHVESWFRD